MDPFWILLFLSLLSSYLTFGQSTNFTRANDGTSTTFHAGIHTLAQEGIYDAQHRYIDYINQMINEVTNRQWPDYNSGSGCHDHMGIMGSAATDKRVSVNMNTLSIVIGNNNNIVFNGDITIEGTVPVYYQWRKRIIGCWHHTICNWKSTHFVLVLHVTGEVRFSIDGNQAIKIDAAVTNMQKISFDWHSSCHISWWVNFLTDVQEDVQEGVESALRSLVGDLNRHITVPRTYSPVDHLTLQYAATRFVSVANSYISFYADGFMTVDTKASDYKTTIKIPFDAAQAAQTVPDFVPARGLIQESKIAIELFTGLIMAGNYLGIYHPNYNTTILNATFVFDASLDSIETTVPRDGVFRVLVPSGKVSATCGTSGYAPNIMLLANFSYLEAFGGLNYTNNVSNPGMYANISNINVSALRFDLIAPKLPLPPSMVERLFVASLQSVIKIINHFTSTNPIVLPEDMAPFVPNPDVELHHSDACCEGEWGWVGIQSRVSALRNMLWSAYETTTLRKRSESPRGIYLVEYDASAENPNCELEADGDQLSRSFLSETFGTCLPTLDQESYYSLVLNEEGRLVDFSLCSSEDCTQNCITQIREKECFAQGSMVLLPMDANCVGPMVPSHKRNKNNIHDANFYLQSFSNPGCGSSLPGDSTTIMQLGKSNQCTLSPSDGTFYSLNTSNEILELHIGCEDKTCLSCAESIAIGSIAQCFPAANYSLKLLMEHQLPNCFFTPPSSRGKLTKGAKAGITLTVWIVVMVGVTVSLYILWKQDKLPSLHFDEDGLRVKANDILEQIGRVIARIANRLWKWLLRIKDRIVRVAKLVPGTLLKFVRLYLTPVSPRVILEERLYHFRLLIPMLIMSGCYFVWVRYDPWKRLISVSPYDLGLDASAFRMGPAHRMLEAWTEGAKKTLLASEIMCGSLLVILLFGRHPESERARKFIHHIGIAFGVLVPFGVLVYPFFYDKILGTVTLDPTYLKLAANQPTIYHYLNLFISDAFVGIVLSYSARLLAYCFHATWGIIFGFQIYLNQHYDDWYAEREGEKRQTLAAYRTCIILMSLLIPLMSIQPVIIIYQQTGIQMWWLLLWFCLWSFNLILSIYWCYCTLVLRFAHLFFQNVSFALAYAILTYEILSRDEKTPSFYQSNPITFPSFYVALLFVAWCCAGWHAARWINHFLSAGEKADPVFVPTITTLPSASHSIQISENLPLLDHSNSGTPGSVGVTSRSTTSLMKLLYKYTDTDPESPTPSFRRIFYTIGMVCFGVYLKYVNADLSTSGMEKFNSILAKIDPGLVWPKGTFLDPCFKEYDLAQLQQFWCLQISFALFGIAYLISFIFPRKKVTSYKISACIGFVAVLLLFVASVASGFHNYSLAANIGSIFPPCSKEFDRAVKMIVGNVIGTYASVLYSVDTLPILLFMSLAIVRSAYLIMNKTRYAMFDSMYLVMLIGSVFSPAATILGFVTLYQLLGDNTMLMLIFVWWILPIVSLYSILSTTSKKKRFVPINFTLWVYDHRGLIAYVVWTITYVGSLAGLLAYIVHTFGLWSQVKETLSRVELYLEIGAELCLSNVVLTDLLFLVNYYMGGKKEETQDSS